MMREFADELARQIIGVVADRPHSCWPRSGFMG
jgi:hypothetical protein